MFELTVTSHFAAAHALKNFEGPCESLHGHNWKVEVTVVGQDLDEAGMVVDFGQLKKMTNQALDELDHSYLNELEAFKDQSPSSENIARHLFDRLSRDLNGPGLKVVRVTAWESETSRVSYLGPDA